MVQCAYLGGWSLVWERTRCQSSTVISRFSTTIWILTVIISGETCSVASSDRKNNKRNINDVEEGLRRQMERRCDLLIIQSGSTNEINMEYCASEVGIKKKSLSIMRVIPYYKNKPIKNCSLSNTDIFRKSIKRPCICSLFFFSFLCAILFSSWNLFSKVD